MKTKNKFDPFNIEEDLRYETLMVKENLHSDLKEYKLWVDVHASLVKLAAYYESIGKDIWKH